MSDHYAEMYRQHLQQIQETYPGLMPGALAPPLPMNQLLPQHQQHSMAMLARTGHHHSPLYATQPSLLHVPPFAPPVLPGVEMRLQNEDMWKDFHEIGTEMIITKSGRRMFPSLRTAISGLDAHTNYCVLIEMVPLGDCRFKYSGTQWLPAGGPEPQSSFRIYVHPDSPASGAHWMAQPVLFNKIKLTNNTLDHSGHCVLASMHKYMPRIHIVRSNDLTQMMYSAQQSFAFPQTEFIAVTAYQNDKITRLKIDNNPFAKGFREQGQSRCKRKIMSASPVSVASATSSSSSSASPSSSNSNAPGNEVDDDDDDAECSTKRTRSSMIPDDEEIDVESDDTYSPIAYPHSLQHSPPTNYISSYQLPGMAQPQNATNPPQYNAYAASTAGVPPTAWMEFAMSVAMQQCSAYGGQPAMPEPMPPMPSNPIFNALLMQQHQHQQHQQHQQQPMGSQHSSTGSLQTSDSASDTSSTSRRSSTDCDRPTSVSPPAALEKPKPKVGFSISAILS